MERPKAKRAAFKNVVRVLTQKMRDVGLEPDNEHYKY